MAEIFRIKNENMEKFVLHKQLNNKYHSSYPATKKSINLYKVTQTITSRCQKLDASLEETHTLIQCLIAASSRTAPVICTGKDVSSVANQTGTKHDMTVPWKGHRWNRSTKICQDH